MFNGVGTHQRQEKKENGGKEGRKNKDQCTEGETPAIDALIVDKEQNKKQKETGRWSPTHTPCTVWSLPTTRMDHTVGRNIELIY